MIGYTERGAGPALFFVHAYPFDHSMWDAQVEFFSSRYRVVTPDVFGFGLSQPSRPWTMADMGSALLDLLNQLGIERCTLAGLSMGGYIAIPFALAQPSRVERLVLAHTRARADNETERGNRDAMIAALRQDGIASLPPKIAPRLLAASAPAPLRQSVTQTIERMSVEACVNAVAAMRDRLDHTAELKTLTCPTLVIAGPEDAIIPIEDSRTLTGAIPRGEMALIPGTGHLSNLEAPSAFNGALDEFLKR